MAFWSDTTLRSKLGQVIIHPSPPNPDQVDTSGYRLTVGPEAYVTGPNSKKDKTSYKLGLDECLYIPAGQFALIQTEEKIKIPDDTFGLISMRSKKKFDGLINVSGFHVDPGFSGRLLFSVFNAGPNMITIRRGEEVFMIWFAELDQPNSILYSGSDNFDQIQPSLIDRINQEVDSLSVVSSKVEQLRNWRNIAVGVLPLVLAILVPLYFAWFLSWNERITELEANNQALLLEVQRQKVEIAQPIAVLPMGERLEQLGQQVELFNSYSEQTQSNTERINSVVESLSQEAVERERLQAAIETLQLIIQEAQ